LIEILSPSGLVPGPDEVGQKGVKLLHLRRHSQKNETKQIFFSPGSKTCRVFSGFEEQLSLAQHLASYAVAKLRWKPGFCPKLPAANEGVTYCT